MEVLKFNLSGQTAFFKKPDVNTYYYFSYGNIHKIALLGIIGATLGLKGYAFQNKDDEYPEFYEKLKDLQVSILPNNERGFITKKVQTFNNSVGYASKEEGGNLIVKEQWLEKPNWTIYIYMQENEICNEIKERFLNMRFKYLPYLGKNDHYANISEVELIEADKILKLQSCDTKQINSLFLKSDFTVTTDDFDLEDDSDFDENTEWKYEEFLPIELEELSNQYIKKSFIQTNMAVKSKVKTEIYRVEDKFIQFY